jgi:outer membrane lipoprotein-sorting protein
MGVASKWATQREASEPRPWRRAAWVLALTLLITAAARVPGAPPEPSLEDLMKSMAATSGVVARFHEVKELSLLSSPLEVSGTLYFIPPDRLARITTRPGRSKLVIDGKRFSFRDETAHEDVDLSGNPVARAFVSNFIVLFNGDLDALRRRYRPDFQVEGRSWTLILSPLGPPLADVVKRVTLEGQGPSLDRMELLETNGDRTTTTFQDVQTDHRFSPAERERIFANPGAAATAQ